MNKNSFQRYANVVCLLLMTGTAMSEPIKPGSDAAAMMAIPTETFTTVALSGGNFEIQSSKIAQEKNVSPDISALAEMIIADHTRANQKLAQLTGTSEKPLEPQSLSPKEQKMLQQLTNASSDEFATLYLAVQLQAHMEAVGLFGTYAGSGDNQNVVGFAKETLPRLQTHLGHVKHLISMKSS